MSWLWGVRTPVKPFFKVYLVFCFHRDALIHLEFQVIRQLYFYISCICKETLLSRMAKPLEIQRRRYDELHVSLKTCTNSVWREKASGMKNELLDECHRVRCNARARGDQSGFR